MITMGLLVESTVKVSLIVVVGLAAAWALRRRSAALRHWVLCAAIVCAALSPLLGLVVPAWYVPVRPVVEWSLGRVSPGQPVVATAPAPQSLSAPGRPGIAAPGAAMTVASLLITVWLAGIAVSVSILLVGFSRLAWIASRARRILDGPWAMQAEEVSRECGLRRPIRLLQSDHPTLLVTWGFVRPKVILPRTAPDWTENRIRIVLLHELAHITRQDWLVQMLAEFVRAAHWFNPLVWIGCRRLRLESEHATDDAVLNFGIDGSDYAAQLVDLARSFTNQTRTWLPAPAIVRPSSLERRVSAMLNASLNCQPTTRSTRLAATATLFGVAVVVASAQGVFATFSGSVFDPSNAVLPNVTMVLTNVQSQAKHEIRTDRTGHFEFVGLPLGEYSLEATLPGFATLRGTLTLSGQDVQRDVTLKIGSLTETITVTSGTVERQSPQARVQRPNPLGAAPLHRRRRCNLRSFHHV